MLSAPASGTPGMTPALIDALLLLALANGAPVLLARLLGPRGAMPVDGGLRFVDGRPLLGPSKTWRGLCAATVSCALCAPLLGLPWWLGAALAALAMLGDLAASFVKRRAGLAASARASGLDQLPESLLPLAVLHEPLSLDGAEVLTGGCVFLLAAAVGSRLLFAVGLRKRPW